MKKLIIICVTFFALVITANAQSYWTKSRQSALTNTLTTAAYNPTWFRDCIRDAGGILKAVAAKQIVLAGPGAPRQFLLTGKISGGECAYGAHSSMNWIVEQKGKAFRLLANIGAADNVRVLGSTHNGYRDLRIGATSAAGRQWDTTVYIFDGSRYISR
jgi:hypothetical protein